MNALLSKQLHAETYLMLNIEITFTGLRQWFRMAGEQYDDVLLFQAVLMPEKAVPEKQAEFAQLVLFRHEDVFFHMHRGLPTDDPIHQLMLRILNVRTLYGEENAVIELWETLNRDRMEKQPKYRSIHEFFSS